MSRALLALIVLSGCAPPRRASLGTECERSSDCAAPLVCRIGFCRNECATSADCAAGLSCLLDGMPGDAHRFGACQLADEATCTLPSECPEGLVCRFGQCTNACNEDRDCPGGARCLPDPGTMANACLDASTTPCTLDGECGAGEFCLSGRCRRQCYADRDCRNGWWCDVAAGVCRDPSIDGGAELDALDAPSRDVPTADVPGRSCGTRAIDGVTGLALGADFGCAVRTGNRLSCWADELTGVSGVNPHTLCAADVAALAGHDVAEVAAASQAICLRSSTGAVECLGSNAHGELGRGAVATPPFDALPGPVAGLTATALVAEPWGERFFALTGGGLVGWGRGSDGELGTGTMASAGAPVAATAFAGATALGSGSAVCAVSGGALVCRGAVLPPMPPARAVIGVTMSELFGCVHDGTVVECFAQGLASIHGVLGDGTTAERLAWGPTGALPAGPAIIDLCSGGQHVCVLRDDREVWCWGTRDGWDAGGMGTQALVPELAVTDADALACGALATCILRGDRVLCGSRYGQMIGVGARMPPPGFNEVLED